MAREGVTRAQVFQAADDISKAGQAPTVASVRAKLGTGSYTTITALLREWKEQAIHEEESDALDVPEEVTAALGRAAELVWKAATDHFARELAAVRKEAERNAHKAAEDLGEAIGEIGRLEGQIAGYEAHVTDLETALQANGDELQEQFRKGANQAAELRELRAQLKAAEARIAEQGELLRRLVPEGKGQPAPKAKRAKQPTRPADAPPVDDKTLPMEL